MIISAQQNRWSRNPLTSSTDAKKKTVPATTEAKFVGLRSRPSCSYSLRCMYKSLVQPMSIASGTEAAPPIRRSPRRTRAPSRAPRPLLRLKSSYHSSRLATPTAAPAMSCSSWTGGRRSIASAASHREGTPSSARPRPPPHASSLSGWPAATRSSRWLQTCARLS